jgi:hypothetical protein
MNRRRFRSALLCCAVIAVFVACDEPTEPGLPNGFWSVGDTWAGQVIITPNTDASYWPSDPVTIQGFTMKGDSLELAVSFGGGCRDHAFLLLSDAAWMESYPVQVGVRLAHDAKGDNCKALISRVLRFDLTPLRAAYSAAYQTSSGIMRLNVRGTSGSPTYSW